MKNTPGLYPGWLMGISQIRCKLRCYGKRFQGCGMAWQWGQGHSPLFLLDIHYL
jgi:hypothetical protein